MKVLYSRVDKDFLTVDEARDVIFAIDSTDKEVEWSDYANLDLQDCCDRLNSENVFDCGTCYYIVEDDITHEELIKLIYS